MKSKSLQRVVLLASGICAVLVILLSHSFYQVSTVAVKAKAEKKSEQKEVVVQAPSDVAPQGQSVELSHHQPAVAEELVLANDQNENGVFIQKLATKLFKTLFRVIISPNAP